MNNRTLSRKTVRRAIIAIVVMVGIMLTMHILVNSFDLMGFMRSIHGGG